MIGKELYKLPDFPIIYNKSDKMPPNAIASRKKRGNCDMEAAEARFCATILGKRSMMEYIY